MLDIRRHPDFSSFYETIKDQIKDKTLDIDNLLNDNKDLRDVSINALDIVKTFFWRLWKLFCYWENPFRNLRNCTRLRVGFNQLKTQPQIGQNQNLRNSKLKCEWLAKLRSQLLAKQSDSKTPELKAEKNDLIK